MTGQRNSQPAFTLIELLVAVSIGLLLIAILLPSLTYSRHQAWRILCANNLRAVGRALDYYRSERGRYPQANAPNRYVALTNIGETSIRELVAGLLHEPEILYCPVSLARDKYALKPYAWTTDSNGRKMRVWQTGSISYIYLPGITYSYPDPSQGGRATYVWKLESPDSKERPRNVLIGDHTVELTPKYANSPLARSNHGRQGGWFCFTTGDVSWWTWPRLTRHPTNHIYDYYWPAMP